MNKTLYRFKTEKKGEVKKANKFKDLADIVGVSTSYISCIVNGRKKNISKMLAYCICKATSPSYEINDLFDIIDK